MLDCKYKVVHNAQRAASGMPAYLRTAHSCTALLLGTEANPCDSLPCPDFPCSVLLRLACPCFWLAARTQARSVWRLSTRN